MDQLPQFFGRRRPRFPAVSHHPPKMATDQVVVRNHRHQVVATIGAQLRNLLWLCEQDKTGTPVVGAVFFACLVVWSQTTDMTGRELDIAVDAFNAKGGGVLGRCSTALPGASRQLTADEASDVVESIARIWATKSGHKMATKLRAIASRFHGETTRRSLLLAIVTEMGGLF